MNFDDFFALNYPNGSTYGEMKKLQSAFEAGQANQPEGCVTRKIFICSSCDGIYADAPVSQCDCSIEPTEFIEGVAMYAAPTPDKDKA